MAMAYDVMWRQINCLRLQCDDGSMLAAESGPKRLITGASLPQGEFNMTSRALASIVVGLLVTTACHKTPPNVASISPSNGHFSMVVEHSTTGWRAHCEAGCRWVDVSMSCGGCEVRLDAAGIGPAYPANSAVTGFAFVLSSDGPGGKARAIDGTQWRALSWSCGAGVCSARIDESGVTAIRNT